MRTKKELLEELERINHAKEEARLKRKAYNEKYYKDHDKAHMQKTLAKDHCKDCGRDYQKCNYKRHIETRHHLISVAILKPEVSENALKPIEENQQN